MNYREELKLAIQKSGLKKSHISCTMGIKYDTFRRKLNGENDFKVEELINLCSILKIKISDIFKEE